MFKGSAHQKTTVLGGRAFLYVEEILWPGEELWDEGLLVFDPSQQQVLSTVDLEDHNL